MAQQDKLLFNEWTNVVSAVRNDLVFEGRNHEYGAYQIRRNYNRTVMVALLWTIGVFVVGVSIPKILELLGGLKSQDKTVAVDLDQLQLDAPPPVDETEPPPPPPPPPPPVATTVKFVPPVIDEQAPDEDPPPVQETEAVVSTVTNEGNGDENVVIPDEGAGVVETTEEIFAVVEEMPSFPGGEGELSKFLQKNINYPQMEREEGIAGTVYVTFVVDKEGKINDVKTLKGVKGGPGLEKEALRVINSMPPWKPGKQQGRSVRVQFNLPIRFSLK